MCRKNATDVKLKSQAGKIGVKSEEVLMSIVFVSGIEVGGRSKDDYRAGKLALLPTLPSLLLCSLKGKEGKHQEDR